MKILGLSGSSKFVTILLHGSIWLVIVAFPFFVENPESETFPDIFHIIVGSIHIALFYFNAFFLYPKLMNQRLWWLFIICLLILILLIFRIKYLILTIGFPDVVYKDYMDALLGFPLILFSVASSIYRIVVDRIEQEKLLKDREAVQLSTELKFLRSQISPHFLFNVLNNMASMSRHKSDQLEPTIIRLAGLMRYMLYESDSTNVLLSSEIDYLISYIELQGIRFEEDVRIITNIEYTGNSETIAPMLLIPFVENAFKHGVAMVEEPFIHIDLKVEGKNLYFTVENKFSRESGHSKDPASGIGLKNVKTHLRILYKDDYQLDIHDEGEIYCVTLKLPLP
jgi:sensor histidine kinase YesM